MAAVCEEVEDLKAQLEELDTLLKRLFGHWWDTRDHLLEFKHACQLFAEGHRRNDERLHQLRCKPNNFVGLIPSPRRPQIRKLLNFLCLALTYPEQGEPAPSEEAVAAPVAPSYASAATTHDVLEATAAMYALQESTSMVAHWQIGKRLWQKRNLACVGRCVPDNLWQRGSWIRE